MPYTNSMQLLEYQAKDLLRRAGLNVPRSTLLHEASELSPEDISLPIVLKSQVPVGGRGKLGGVKIIKSVNEFARTYQEIWLRTIKGHLPSAILLEEMLEIEREYYLSLRLNRDHRRIEWLVSGRGGIDIEDNPESVIAIPFAGLTSDDNAYETISSSLNIDVSVIKPLLKKLEKCFSDNDMLLLEINPLVITSDHKLICADAKVLVDDNALFRQPLMTTEAISSVMPLGGTIGVIANGAGMAMSTMDTIYASGGRPANFLDIGGGTGEDVFIKNLRTIRDLPNVRSIIVNIFAGITHCDDIARGIISARQQIDNLPPLYIRLEGTNREEAVKLLDKAGIEMQTDLATCVQKALSHEKPSTSNQATISKTAPGKTLDSKQSREPVPEPNLIDTDVATEQEVSSLLKSLYTNQPTIVQGITGHHGSFHTLGMLKAGTNIVAGVTPGKAGAKVHEIPVYDTVAEAVTVHKATASIVFVPAKFARTAMLEALDAGIKLIVCITEGIPVHDMLAVKLSAVKNGATLVGPNCPGFIIPGSHKLGIIATSITSPGTTAIISRSGTLTYELAHALTQKGIGQSIVLGIGGDPIQGLNFKEAIEACQRHENIDRIIIVGEIGGTSEQIVASYVKSHVTKPVYGLVVGHSLPAGQQFGHAGAIVGGLGESASEKTTYMASCNINMSTTLDELLTKIQ